MFVENKYLNIYNNFINKRKNRKNFNGDFYEEHHIKPRSLGGTNDRSNLVKLTPREHYFAHELLVRITDGADQIKMVHALSMMSDIGNAKGIINASQYETAKKVRYNILQSVGKSYQHEKEIQNSVLAEYTDINKVFERGTCTECGIRPRAINYVKNNKTYYRKKCDTCIEGRNQFKVPEWKIRGYEKKLSCEKCGFTAKYVEQLTVVKKNKSFETICLNCQVDVMLSKSLVKKGPIADF